MGLTVRLWGLLAGSSARLEQLADLVRARLASPEGQLVLPAGPKAGFDRLMDALNRLPRPLLALGTLAIFAAALIDPVWFAGRMQALSDIPEPLWWLCGAVISLFFGSRMQTQGQQFQREIAGALAVASLTPASLTPANNDSTPQVAATGADARLTLLAVTPAANPALQGWLTTTA